MTIFRDSSETLNLREGPGTDFPTLKRLDPGENLFVLEGPACADGYTWYKVIHRGTEGWVAEGDTRRYYVEPYLPG